MITETTDENLGKTTLSVVKTGALHFTKIGMIEDFKKKFTEKADLSADEAEEHLIYGMNISLVTGKAKIKEGVTCDLFHYLYK